MNSLTTPRSSTLLLQKLSRLVIRLQQQANPQGSNEKFATLEATVGEAYKILSQFYKDLSGPIYKPTNTLADTIPTAEEYNNNFTGIGDDLKTIFAEFQNMQGVVLGNFNYMTSRLNKLQGKLKTVSSLLGDFILYSDLATKDALFFSDSFNNTQRIEVNSPLLNTEQCEIDQDQGIITLPVDHQAQVKITVSDIPVINLNSNGVIGNNQETGAVYHGTITDILDGNADTWFEYERVVSVDDGIALILDLTINLGTPRVINFIRINPNNFGTRTPVEIDALDTSLDGHVLTSVKDDIPIAGFVAQDEANTFILAGSSSKFSGQGLFTFTPRKVKYVHITLRQTTPYIINSTTSPRYRYAIGIRDVEIAALPYKTQGEIISTNFVTTEEIRKLVLLSSQNPDPATTSLLASIDHYVSPDNGVSWYQIRPKVSSGAANVVQGIPELLDFNGGGTNSISTSSPVSTLRYKAVLKRNKDAFSADTPELAQETENVSDLFQMPISSPFSFKLQKTAIPESIRVLDPDIGTFGDSTARKPIAIGTGGKLVIELPFVIPRMWSKTPDGTTWKLSERNALAVYVDGQQWSAGLLSGTNKYFLVKNTPISSVKPGSTITFGDGTSGAAVGQGRVVSISFDSAPTINPSRGPGHTSAIPFPTTKDTSRSILFSVEPLATRTDLLRKGSRVNQLKPFIGSTSGSTPNTSGQYRMIFSDTSVFASPVAFSDGSSELVSTGQYSVDLNNGVLYSYDSVDDTTDTTVTYAYTPATVLGKDDWSFIDMPDGNPGISISDSAYKTWKITGEAIPAGVKYFNLSRLAVVQGTVVFAGTTGATPTQLSKEVPFVDGHQELLGVIKTSEQLPASTSWSSLSPGVLAKTFNMKIASDTSLQIQFSRTDIFLVKKSNVGALSTDGDYCIEYSGTYPPTGRLVVKLSQAYDDLGTVTYYYEDPQAALTSRYSINYLTGEVYCYEATPSNTTVSFEYTNYLLSYTAARKISSDDWEFDAVSNTVTLKDREIIKNLRIPSAISAGGVGSTKMYEIDYQHIKKPREDIDELEPFFSPILRDYALKIIPKSRLL